MGFHVKEFAARTGLTFDRQASTFCGTRDQYPVFVRYQARQGTMLFVLYGRTAETDNPEISTKLEQWRYGRQGISALNYGKNCLSCMVAIPARNADEETYGNFEALMELARTLGLTPCCMACGTEYGFSPYLLDNTGVSLCPSCRASTEQRMGEVREEKQAEKSSIPGLALSVLVGAAAVAVLTYLVLRAGYVSYLVGYAGVLIMFLMMRKFGKKVTLPAGLTGVLVCLLIAAAVPVFSFAQDISSFNRENAEKAQQYCESYEEIRGQLDQMTEEDRQMLEETQGITLDLPQMEKQYQNCQLMLSHQDTGSCFRDMGTLMKSETYSGSKSDLIKSILWGVISIIVGSALTMPRMLSESSGKHELREIAA